MMEDDIHVGLTQVFCTVSGQASGHFFPVVSQSLLGKLLLFLDLKLEVSNDEFLL